MKTKEEQVKRAKQVALIAGIFTGLTGLLLVLNYLQIQSGDPLNSLALKTLVDRLSMEPDNHQLMEEVRQLDLLARKAYFSSIWQIETGAWLMLIGAVVLIFALRVLHKLRFNIEEPIGEHLTEQKIRLKTQRWIAVSGLSLLALAGLSAIFSINHLKKFDAAKVPTVNQADAGDIEKIEINSADSTLQTDSAVVTDSTALAVIPLNEATIKQQHNSFRGAWGNGVSAATGVPTSWNGSTGKNVLWKTPIAVGGNNSPIIWGDRIFLSGGNTKKRVVYCFDRNTGIKLWEQEVSQIPGSPATQPKTTDDTGLAAPSMTADGSLVFALFGNGDIIAFDHAGKKAWARNLGVPANHYGHSSSLLTWGGKIFVQYDTQNGCKVMALSNQTGKTVWTTARSNEISWSSPILAKVNGKIQLILQANPNVAGYDLNSGKQLWTVDCMTGEVGPSPAFGGGLVYAANEYAKMVAINPSNGEIVWENSDKLPEVSSPVFFGGHLFVATTYSVLACMDAKTGSQLWEYEGKAAFYSSPMIASGRLYIFDTSGKAYIFTPGSEAKLIASPELGEKVYATPVFSDGRIYIRGIKNLYCIGKK